jgi:iron-sulfur cluster assembly protein
MAITVTETAAQHIKSFLAKRGKGEGLRLGIRSSGCSGFAYTVDYADAIHPQDTVFEDHGVKVVVDPKWLPFLDGMEVDYGREGLNAGFRFNNPNIKASCGCGESFSV